MRWFDLQIIKLQVTSAPVAGLWLTEIFVKQDE